MARNRRRAGKFVVLKTAAGGSKDGNGGRCKRVTIMSWKAIQEIELDAEFSEIACIYEFKMLTLANETSIYTWTADFFKVLFGNTVFFEVRS